MSGPRRTASLTGEEFAECYRSASRALWTIAAGILGGPSEAEDVLQEACSMAYPKRAEFEPGTNFTAWMGRFVRFVALNQLRKRGRRGTHAEDPERLDQGLDGERASVLRAGLGAELALPMDARGRLLSGQAHFDDHLVRALAGLAPLARSCLLLRAVLELEYREIAEVLEIPEGTAMSHVSRSRAALRVWLAGEPGAPSRTESVSNAEDRP